MRVKKFFIGILLSLLMVSFILPSFSVKADSEWQKLDKEIQKIQQEKKEAADRAKNIDNQIDDIQNKQQNLQHELEQIKSEISVTEEKKFALEKEIEDVTNEAKIAANDLEAAKKRVEERDDLLKTRLRLMYRHGKVQYMEVLLGSKSFSDFLRRFDALQKILQSDKNILQDNIDDKKTIEAKKNEIDSALADLQGLYTDLEELKASLIAKEKERSVKIASLEQKQQELEEFRDEEEELITELASKESNLIKRQKELIYNGGVFAWPVPESHRITSEFGMRIDPINGSYSGHKGLDIGHAPGKSSLYGADILAAADGVVIVAYYVSGFGNTIMIDHGSGLWTLYGHIRNGGIEVKVGQTVERGQKIAEVGSTGRSTGPHLHFEVRKNKVPVSPWDYLKKF